MLVHYIWGKFSQQHNKMVPVLVAVILCLLTPAESASTSDVLVTRDWEVSDKLVDIKPEWLTYFIF